MKSLEHIANESQSIERFPVVWAEVLRELLGECRYVWATRDACLPFQKFQIASIHQSRSWLGIVASHQSKFGFTTRSWQRSLDSALRLARQQGWGISWAVDTPYAAMIQHAVQRHGLAGLQIVTRLQDKVEKVADDPTHFFDRITITQTVKESPCVIPLHDRSVVYLSDYVFAIDVRHGGKIERLLSDRLSQTMIPPATTYVAWTGNSAQEAVKRYLMQQGAVAWIPSQRPCAIHDSAHGMEPQMDLTQSSTLQPVLRLDQIQSTERYLVHCTRGRKGPWPDQSIDQFHDEVFLNGMDIEPTPMESLIRILRKQRLIATQKCRQGDRPTVCFSERPIRSLLEMRRFQSHLGRWDWEPYGLMIDRKWMQENGAKQVQYVSKDIAKHMPSPDRTFAQVVSNDPHSQDWREEQEWRVAGDLRFHLLPFADGIVFVPTRSEAIRLRYLSRWPIAWLQNDCSDVHDGRMSKFPAFPNREDLGPRVVQEMR